MKFIKKYYYILLIILLAILFFVGVSSFNYFTQYNDFIKWGSPDETANYIFTKLYAQTGDISFYEKYNLYTKDIMHPRSFRSDFGVLKPVSFLGIILIYGKIASFFSYKIIPYLTPFFAGIGIIFYYLLVKKIFNKKNALISSFILSCFPVYIFYTARSMFHNVIFTVFLIIGLYFSFLITQKRKQKKQNDWQGWIYSGLAGCFFGLSIICRTSELIWIMPLLFLLWILNIKKIGISKFIIFIAFLGIAILPALYYNQILYSSPYFGGYSEMNQSIINIKNTGSSIINSSVKADFLNIPKLINNITNTIFHFGFHPKQSLRMVNYYIIKMFPILSTLAIIGFAIFLRNWKKQKPKHWKYLIALALTSAILILYYGSWKFYDNPDKTRHTIGNSYTRYWLPIYLGIIPFASLFIIRFTFVVTKLFSKFKNVIYKSSNKFFSYRVSKKFIRNILYFLILFFIFLTSIKFVLFGSEEGLFYIAERQKKSYQEYKKIIELTEKNSTIITFYHDKLLFPKRKVIVGSFADKNMVAEYSNLVDYLPVYYYNFTLPGDAINWLNNSRLGEVNLSISKIKKITPDFTLYKINKIRK